MSNHDDYSSLGARCPIMMTTADVMAVLVLQDEDAQEANIQKFKIVLRIQKGVWLLMNMNLERD